MAVQVAHVRSGRPQHQGFPLASLRAGAASGRAVELLSSRTFEVLLDGWAHQFDHIIIDSPPANEYPDALALGTIARRALIVNRAQHTSVNASRTVGSVSPSLVE